MSDKDADDDIDDLEYEGSLPSCEEIQADVVVAWSEAWAEDPHFRQLVRPLNPHGAAPPQPFLLKQTQGADPLTVTLIIAAHVGAVVSKRVAFDLWKKILLPKLERRWGEGAAREMPRRRSRKK